MIILHIGASASKSSCRELLQEEAGGEVGDLMDRLLAHMDEQAAEIKRLQALREAEWEKWDGQVKSYEMMISDLRGLAQMAAYWRHVAIEERAARLLDARAAWHITDIGAAREQATRELETESSKHFSAATKMISMTDERRAALDRAARFIMWADHAGHLREGVASKDAEIIRGMLAEAER